MSFLSVTFKPKVLANPSVQDEMCEITEEIAGGK